MPRFSAETSLPHSLVTSIEALAEATMAQAVDAVMDAVQAHRASDERTVAMHVSRLAVGTAVAAGELARLAEKLEAGPAGTELIATAGAVVTGLQSSLLSIAAAVQDLADAGAPSEAQASAKALRHAALGLDDLLPAYQPGR